MGGGFWGPILVLLPPLFIQQYCWMNHHPGAGNAVEAHMPAAGRVSVLLSHFSARQQAESCLTRRHRTPAAATASVSCTVGSDRVEFEVDFRWIGEPSISFFVELALAGCAQSAHP